MTQGQEPRPETVEEARGAVEESRESISRDLDVLGSRLGEKREQVVAKAEAVKDRLNVLKQLRGRVRSNPWPSVGIALGAGVAAGMMSGWRSRVRARRAERRRERQRWRRERRARLSALEEGRGMRRGRGISQLRRLLTGPLAASIASAVARSFLEGPRGPAGGRTSTGRPVGEA